MKIEELRIGNYYRAGLEINGSREAKLNPMDGNRVIRLSIDHFQVFVNAPMIVEMINPIELTEEWVLRLGFEQQTPKYFVLDLGEFSMRYYYNFSGSTWQFELEDKRIDLQFVHQVQNILASLAYTQEGRV